MLIIIIAIFFRSRNKTISFIYSHNDIFCIFDSTKPA